MQVIEFNETDLAACLAACVECHETCERMLFEHCPRLGGSHAEAVHLKLMADCAQICRVAADFMIRKSPCHPLLCWACAEICESCAADCERVGEMEKCVAVCRHCAATCRQMAELGRTGPLD